MQPIKYLSLCMIGLVLGQAFSLPQHPVYVPQQYQQQVNAEERKFAEKPNTMKKVAHDSIDDVETNQIAETGTGFAWTNLLSSIMQIFLPPNPGSVNPSKNDIDDSTAQSPWTNLLSVGLRILTAFLSGNQQTSDGIDKVDAPANPVQQFIHIVINLLDALKTSFSHRSLSARSLGKRDTISDAAVASISMLKGYMRSMKSFESVGRAEEEGQRGCAERALCEASAECVADIQGNSSIFCQLGSYATSYLMQRQSGVEFEALYEAGRRGRSGEDCRTLFLDCNAV